MQHASARIVVAGSSSEGSHEIFRTSNLFEVVETLHSNRLRERGRRLFDSPDERHRRADALRPRARRRRVVRSVGSRAYEGSDLTARHLYLVAALGIAACGRGPVAPAPEPARASFQLFLLAGQSNMAGRGVVEDEDRVENPRVLMFDRLEIWKPAVDPVHFDKPIAGVGPARSFGIAVAAADSSIRIGLIPTAVGGSPISSWEPGALDRATRTHPWDDAIVRARAAMKDGTLRAILWHQGESDSNAEAAPLYEQRLRALIERFRKELGDPTLPFLIGQLGRFDGNLWDAPRITVDSVHRALAAQIPNVAFVSSEGLKDKGDNTHFTAAGARELGRRYAEAYLRLVQH